VAFKTYEKKLDWVLQNMDQNPEVDMYVMQFYS